MSNSGRLQSSKLSLGNWNEQQCLKFVMIMVSDTAELKIAVQGMLSATKWRITGGVSLALQSWLVQAFILPEVYVRCLVQ